MLKLFPVRFSYPHCCVIVIIRAVALGLLDKSPFGPSEQFEFETPGLRFRCKV